MIKWNDTTPIFRWGPIPGKYFYMSDFMTAIFLSYPKIPDAIPWVETLLLTHKHQIVWLNDDNEIQEVAQKVFQEKILKRGIKEYYLPPFYNSIDDLHSFYKKINLDYLSSLSKQELEKIYREFLEFIDVFWLTTIEPEFSGYGSIQVLSKLLEEYIPNSDIADALEVLTAPEEKTFYQIEELDLLHTQNIKDHREKYIWIRNSYDGVQYPSLDDFVERKKTIPDNLGEHIRQNFENIKKRKKDIIAKYSLPNEIIDTAKEIVDAVVMQDKRKREIFIIQHYKYFFLKEFTRRFNVDVELLEHYGIHEILSLFSDKQLKRRGDYHGVYANTNVLEKLSEQDAKKYWDNFANEKINSITDEFFGTIASRGLNITVVGKARIILHSQNARDFNNGDILVTPMTSPEFVTLMKKAGAIITDTGGLTSHAAIISRELQKTCIVGTKVATQVLSDGDLIEVNAESGMIKILEKFNK